MKRNSTFCRIFLVFLTLVMVGAVSSDVVAQKAQKIRLRLKADYIKIMDGEAFLDIKTSARIDKRNVAVPHIDFSVFNTSETEKITLGEGVTNAKGECKFVLPHLDKMIPDTTNTYAISVVFNGNDSYRKSVKRLGFRDANIETKLVVKDSVNYISGTLRDAAKDSLVAGAYLEVGIQRLFSPLPIGEEFNETNGEGTILVPIEDGIPGVDGNLMIEVVLNDSDEYGTVKAILEAPIGKPIVEESTFDQRTLWSPRNKTPIFILVIANVLILGIWGFLIYLISNFFKIAKS